MLIYVRNFRAGVITIQEIADTPNAYKDPAAGQLGMDLRDAAVFGVAEYTDQGNNVESELGLRRGELPLLFGAETDPVAGTVGVATAADLQPQSDKPLQVSNRPLGLEGRP